MSDLAKLIMYEMGWDLNKTKIWFRTPNPLLGGMSPEWYEVVKGRDRLEKFINEEIDGNNKR